MGRCSPLFSPGGRIAVDRAKGWTRQLRITPLSVRTYFVAKLITAYVIALPTLAALYLAGASVGGLVVFFALFGGAWG